MMIDLNTYASQALTLAPQGLSGFEKPQQQAITTLLTAAVLDAQRPDTVQGATPIELFAAAAGLLQKYAKGSDSQELAALKEALAPFVKENMLTPDKLAQLQTIYGTPEFQATLNPFLGLNQNAPVDANLLATLATFFQPRQVASQAAPRSEVATVGEGLVDVVISPAYAESAQRSGGDSAPAPATTIVPTTTPPAVPVPVPVARAAATTASVPAAAAPAPPAAKMGAVSNSAELAGTAAAGATATAAAIYGPRYVSAWREHSGMQTQLKGLVQTYQQQLATANKTILDASKTVLEKEEKLKTAKAASRGRFFGAFSNPDKSITQGLKEWYQKRPDTAPLKASIKKAKAQVGTETTRAEELAKKHNKAKSLKEAHAKKKVTTASAKTMAEKLEPSSVKPSGSTSSAKQAAKQPLKQKASGASKGWVDTALDYGKKAAEAVVTVAKQAGTAAVAVVKPVVKKPVAIAAGVAAIAGASFYATKSLASTTPEGRAAAAQKGQALAAEGVVLVVDGAIGGIGAAGEGSDKVPTEETPFMKKARLNAGESKKQGAELMAKRKALGLKPSDAMTSEQLATREPSPKKAKS